MKIEFESEEECASARSAIHYDTTSIIVSDNTKESIAGFFISEVKKALDSFYIRDFDRIGRITCTFCGKHWTAICPNEVDHIPCSFCGTSNKIENKY